MREHSKGILLGFTGSVFSSTFTVSTRYLMQFMNQPTLMSLWFMSASVMLFLASLYSRKKRLLGDLKLHWKAGVVIGLTNLAAAALMFTSVRIIGPSPTAFLAKLDVIFIVLLGFLFLREKLNYKELAGVMVAVSGGFIFAFSSGSLAAASYIGVLAALAIGINTLFARFYTQNIPISVLQLYRVAITAAGFLGFALLGGYFILPETRFIFLAAGGALLSAVIGIGLYYSALKRIKAPFAAILRNLDPFFVAIYAYPLFHTFPTLRQWAGGLVIIAGVTITILEMNSNYSKIYKKTGETQTLDA